MADCITIEILPSGQIKTDTDGVSAPNHTSAEGFMRLVSQLAGGRTEIKLKDGHTMHNALHRHTIDGHHH